MVIPAYNCEGFLAEAVDSIYAQTVAPSEVIVVNDGSTDGTEGVLRRLAAQLEPKFRWITKENRGPASARNHGVRLATGEYIAFLDSDDLWSSQKLARHLDHFAGDPEVDLSFTAMTVVPYERADDGSLRPLTMPPEELAANPDRPEEHEVGPSASYLHPDWDPKQEAVLRGLMTKSPIGSPSTVMIRRDAFNRVGGFDENVRVLADWGIWLKLAAANMKIDHIPESMVEYRWHGANLSADRLHLWNRVSTMFDGFLRSNQLPRRMRKRIGLRRSCAHWHLLTAIEELHAGNRGAARRHVIRAARIHLPSVRPGWIRLLGIGPPSPARG